MPPIELKTAKIRSGDWSPRATPLVRRCTASLKAILHGHPAAPLLRDRGMIFCFACWVKRRFEHYVTSGLGRLLTRTRSSLMIEKSLPRRGLSTIDNALQLISDHECRRPPGHCAFLLGSAVGADSTAKIASRNNVARRISATGRLIVRTPRFKTISCRPMCRRAAVLQLLPNSLSPDVHSTYPSLWDNFGKDRRDRQIVRPGNDLRRMLHPPRAAPGGADRR